ncbi:hypothetical protein AKO1_009451 [Acrasis kona]|uniref:Rieske domain-containing protein n=1 Tax=Acrasis kona TaxID=1008807 RepID=A0AAW2ZLM1_9EUKA
MASHNKGFKNNWYPIIYSDFITTEKHYSTKIWGEPVVLFRGPDNEPVCLQDRCPHRSAPLSLGTTKSGVLSCAYHGWKFSTGGQCVGIPESKSMHKEIRAKSYITKDSQGVVFIWWGQGEPNVPIPTTKEYDDPNFRKGSYLADVDVNYSFHLSNLFDPVHFHLLHDGSIPDINAANYGRLEPKEILDTNSILRYTFNNPEKRPGEVFDISFDPGLTWTLRLGTVDSDEAIVIQQAFHVPISENRTRLLFRMYLSMQRIPIMRYVPQFLYDLRNKSVMYHILGEDINIIKGHFNRSVKYGAPEVNRPLVEDQLLIRFHKWERECLELDGGRPWFESWTSREKCVGCNCGPESVIDNEYPSEYPPANQKWVEDFNWWVKFLKVGVTVSVGLVAALVYKSFV